MSDRGQLLFELGCEELPPLALNRLAQALFDELTAQLKKTGIDFDAAHSRWFATPRRLALTLGHIQRKQPDRVEDRRGPALQAAFDAEGKPTPAALGFARSCGVEVEQLEQRETEKGAWLYYSRKVPGASLAELLPDLLQQALDRLPVPKRMRWGDQDYQFVRPVHWLLCMLDDEVLPMHLLGLQSDRISHGHRFMHPQPVSLQHASEYVEQLQQAYVLVCPQMRRTRIVEHSHKVATELGGQVVLHDEVLDEVVNLVEWPEVLAGRFDAAFLQVPQECLITSMEEHQRFFPVIDANDKLMAAFVAVANIRSPKPEVIVSGYEKVIRPRLADARFFWDTDRKQKLVEYQPRLADMVFQQKLGTLLDKTRRLEKLATSLHDLFAADEQNCLRAAALCKCDLVTDMVYEFTELQGVMGKYYALESGEDAEVAQAIEDHYHPRFAGDTLPQTATGRVLALADRLDTLTGIFAMGQKPTGNKDPFALRRAALGVIRLLVENQVHCEIQSLLQQALQQLPKTVSTEENCLPELQAFLLERLRGWLAEQGFTHGVIEAVVQIQSQDFYDVLLRARALQDLQGSDAMQSLAQANKRINNILRKQDEQGLAHVDANLLQQAEEQQLFHDLVKLQPSIAQALQARDYMQALQSTATLQQPVDAFFDAVMVMAEDDQLRHNRLALLQQLQQLLHAVADLSQLS